MTHNMTVVDILAVHVDIDGIWRSGLFWSLTLCSLLIVAKFYSRIGLSLSLLFLYLMVRSLALIEYPLEWFGDATTAFQSTAGQSLIEVLLFSLGAYLAPKKIWKLIWLTVIGEIVCIWFRPTGGLMFGTSFDSALIAACLPFLPGWLKLLTVVTVLTHHGNTALLILAAQAFAWLLKDPGHDRWEIFALSGVGLCSAAFLHSGHGWESTFERMGAFQRFLGFWWDVNTFPHVVELLNVKSDWKTIAFGFGPGSFMNLSLMIDKFEGELFLQLHSDWLQVIFDLGLMGFILILFAWVSAVRRAWDDPQVVMGLFGIAAFAVTYHPLRYLSAFLVALVVRESLLIVKEGGVKFPRRNRSTGGKDRNPSTLRHR